MHKDKEICIGSDHAGYELKEQIRKELEGEGYEVKDFGTWSRESVDYPDFIHPLATAVSDGTFSRGIIICGSGNGVSMTANKHYGIRAALCWLVEIAEMARMHNDANILALPARYISEIEAMTITRTFLTTAFEGGRHRARVEKINKGS
jgi:ribose 5-phosphate isomerase B